jgi:hypothetical protein
MNSYEVVLPKTVEILRYGIEFDSVLECPHERNQVVSGNGASSPRAPRRSYVGPISATIRKIVF